MEISTLRSADWDIFLAIALQEGWRVPEQELDLFRGPLASGAFALRENVEALGFVTVVAYEKHGWIGNLIVHPACRGLGYGNGLFDHAVAELTNRGMETIWLTASAMGKPLYEKKGFRKVDEVVRRERTPERSAPLCGEPGRKETLLAADARVWGERRTKLIEPLIEEGQVLAAGDAIALLQRKSNPQILGPWYSPNLCPRENRRILASILCAAREGCGLITDVLASSPVNTLLAAVGFSEGSRCDLMVRGPVQGVDLSSLVSLASLGSMG